MPRDTTQLLEAPPNLAMPSLAGLAWLLRHKEAWPEGFVWGYRECATCAIGLGARLWYSTAVSSDPDRYWAKKAFAIPTGATFNIFCRLRDNNGFMGGVTPAQVADAIDAYLATESSNAT